MRSTLLVAVALGLATVTMGEARANVITFQASLEYSGGTPPAGAAPWLSVSFDDGGQTGSVILTVSATNLTGNESLKECYLNLQPTLDPNALTFSSPTKVGEFDDATISLGANQFRADGDGYYDILLTFVDVDGSLHRFTAGDSVSYTITGIPSLSAGSFDCLSEQGGGRGKYPMAAHVLNTGADGSGSGWVTVPEPAGLSLLALGALAMMRRRRSF